MLNYFFICFLDIRVIKNKESYIMETQSSQTIAEQIHSNILSFDLLFHEITKRIVGQKDIIESMTIALLCNSHMLIEGVPGIAKTTLIKTMADSLGLNFKRIQFTPDLLPTDLIGTLIYNPKTHEFETKKGPIFANIILADEINRAPAKVQSALLEAMQEHQVTIGTQTFAIQEPFLVFATQNPVEQEGTYRLPEAQIDRFMFKELMYYPKPEEEHEILKRSLNTTAITPAMDHQQICHAQELVKQVYTDEKIVHYIIDIVFATREPEKYNVHDIKPFIAYGASPRATLALNHASKAHAFLQKRHFVTPDDVKKVAPGILRHRIPLTYEAEAQEVTADQIIEKIMQTIPSP